MVPELDTGIHDELFKKKIKNKTERTETLYNMR